jgi:ATP-dependent exoDNAse (exonuclease V) beta subunit
MNQTQPQFFVYSASAGSGKTFTITKEYLKLCLSSKDPRKFREILAITFTNKAAAEMKNRILDTLERISLQDHDGTSLETEKLLLKELALEKDILIVRAKATLSSVLHNYSDFSISTIDHFTHRLVRTFATDLKLSPAFDVEIDERRIQSEATDLLISKAGTEKDLTKVLNAFLSERLESEKSWNLETSILDVSAHINKERSRDFVTQLKSLNLQQFIAAKKKIDTRLEEIKTRLVDLATDGSELLEKNGIEPHHIATTSKVSKYFEYVSGWVEKSLFPSDKLKQTIKSENWVSPKGKKEGVENTMLSIFPQIRDCFEDILGELEQNGSFIFLAKEVSREFYSMAVIEQVAACIDEIKEEENIIPLSEFNHLISKEIRDQPSPYLYERLGERYKSFFIDEFQDTSIMQWQNLLPLINNALSEGGYCMLVGDAKQSIYRWRGGEAEQFIGLYENIDLLSSNYKGKLQVPAAEVQPMSLKENWRSAKNIVNFNNDLYNEASKSLENPAYKEIYEKAHQNPMGKDGGFVQLEIFEKRSTEESAPFYLDRTIEEINKALNAGYNYRDICVLVKKNDYASWLLAKFSESQIPAYASGALMVNKSKEVAWVVSVLNWHLNVKDNLKRLEFLKQTLLNKLLPIAEKDHHEFLKTALAYDVQAFSEFLDAKFPYINKILKGDYFLFDVCEHLFYESGIWSQTNTFISSFLDEVHNFSTNKEPLLSSFLEYWENFSDNITVDPPENMNQVAVMTIHKSKGLEFPVVIVPFADWSLKKSSYDRAWIETQDLEIPVALIAGSKTAADNIGGAYAEKANEMNQQSQFDSLNALYVATTRPKEVLILMTRLPREKEGNVFHVFKDYLGEKGFGDTPGIYPFGAYPEKEQVESVIILEHAKPLVKPWGERVAVSSSSPIGWPFKDKDPTAWGNKVHYLLAEIDSLADVSEVINRASRNGTIDKEEGVYLAEKLKATLESPDISNYFSEDVTVYNERDIIHPNGKIKRPDRIVQQGNNWAIIDYKTGASLPKHKAQLDEYADLLGKENVKKHLVYINEEIEVVSW